MSEQVLIISFWNPTEKLPHQGIFIQEHAAAICSMRDNVTFLQVNVMEGTSLLPEITVGSFPFFNNRRITLDIRTRLWKFYYVRPALLFRIIKKRVLEPFPELSPALVHANVIFPCGVVARLLSQKFKAKLLISEHWSKTGRILRHPAFRRRVRRAYMTSEAILCVSKFLTERLAASLHHPDIITIPNIVDTGLFSYRPKAVSRGRAIRFLCVASWRPPKRLGLIIDSLYSLAADGGADLELTIAGDGLQTLPYRNRPASPGLKLVWAGFLDKPEIASLMQQTDYFLHASDIETFSLVTAEALSTGTPVLASATGALPELVNDNNGVLAENDPESWLKGLKKLLSKSFDHEAIALENSEKFSAAVVGKSIISVYDNILNP